MKSIKNRVVSIKQYNKIMAKIAKKDLPFPDILIAMLDEAAKYTIKDK